MPLAAAFAPRLPDTAPTWAALTPFKVQEGTSAADVVSTTFLPLCTAVSQNVTPVIIPELRARRDGCPECEEVDIKVWAII